MAKINTAVKKSIVDTVHYLENRIRVTEVILFGSHAVGKPHPYSDIDIAVISPDFNDKNSMYKADIAAQVKINCPSDVEIHPVAQKNLKMARPTNFLGHILKTGRVVYKNGAFSI